jgi:hypothetical protein
LLLLARPHTPFAWWTRGGAIAGANNGPAGAGGGNAGLLLPRRGRRGRQPGEEWVAGSGVGPCSSKL